MRRGVFIIRYGSLGCRNLSNQQISVFALHLLHLIVPSADSSHKTLVFAPIMASEECYSQITCWIKYQTSNKLDWFKNFNMLLIEIDQKNSTYLSLLTDKYFSPFHLNPRPEPNPLYNIKFIQYIYSNLNEL